MLTDCIVMSEDGDGRDAKRVKLETEPSVQVSSLVKTKPLVFSSDGSFPSAGYLQNCRVAAKQVSCMTSCCMAIWIDDINSNQDEGHDAMSIYFSSNRRIYSICHQGRSDEESVRGKEGMLLPTLIPDHDTSLIFDKEGVSELQCLSLSPDLLLGAIDSRGGVHCIDISSPEDNAVLSLTPPKSSSSREEGWTALSWKGASHRNTLASASYQGKYLALFKVDGGSPEEQYHTIGNPTALQWTGEDVGLIAVAEEGRGISLWDPRQSSACHLVISPRNSGSSETLHSLSWVPPIAGGYGSKGGGGGGGQQVTPSSSSMGLLAAAGTDRQLNFYEPRKWQSVGRFSGSAKYAIIGTLFSTSDPRYCYISSLDYEVTVGRWEPNTSPAAGASCSGNSNNVTGGHGRAVGPSLKVHPAASRNALSLSFRGDARWLGMAHVVGASEGSTKRGDEIVAFAQSGSVFVLKSKLGT